MTRLHGDDSHTHHASPADWSGGATNPDCWAEMQAQAAQGGHAAWASLASQRPAVEDRLSRLVDTIERDIIPRLVRAHASAPAAAPAAGPAAGPAAVSRVRERGGHPGCTRARAVFWRVC